MKKDNRHTREEDEQLLHEVWNDYVNGTVTISLAGSPLLGLAVCADRLGKLHNLPQITQFFTSLNLPFPAFTAQFVASVEFVGGILLILGLLTRFTGLVLAINMFVAYWTADHEALTSIFSDPGKFYVADPYTFLFAALMVLIFGAGPFSIDKVIATRSASWMSRLDSGKADHAKQVPAESLSR
jgi:putative oxidoreductase